MKQGATLYSSTGEIILPREVVTQIILPYCKPSDLANFSQSSSANHDLANDQFLWLDLLNYHFKEEGKEKHFSLDEQNHPKKLFIELYEKQKREAQTPARSYASWLPDIFNIAREKYRKFMGITNI